MPDYDSRARALVRARDFAGLSALLDAAAEAGAMTPQLEIWAANLARERGQLDAAAAGYARGLAAQPDNFAGWFNLGLTREAQADLGAAAEAFARSLARPSGHRDSLFRLGACLDGLGREQAARELYAEAVARGLLIHAMQRPRHCCPGLRAQPLWSSDAIPGLERLRAPDILAELRRLVTNARANEHRGQWRSPALAEGRWDKLFFAYRGQLNPKLDGLCPETMAALAQVPLAADLPEGNVCLSILAPGTEIRPHCGPTNVRLRAHLGLDIPPDCGLRVAGHDQTWRAGEWLVFDDSFEHAAWNRSERPRVILIVDLWHPELRTPAARRAALRGLPRR